MSIILNNLKTNIFSNISLTLNENEKIAIVGENGIGKTTFLRTLMGLVTFEGDIKILDKNLKEKKDFKSIYRDIGYLFQDSDDSFIAPSVHEEIAFSLYNKNGDFEEAMTLANELIKEFKIDNLKDKIPIKLSGGQKRLVALASILIHKPKILLLDEPSNHLDSSVENMIKEKLKKFEGNIIMVSHNMEFAKDIVDSFYKFDEGSLRKING